MEGGLGAPLNDFDTTQMPDEDRWFWKKNMVRHIAEEIRKETNEDINEALSAAIQKERKKGTKERLTGGIGVKKATTGVSSRKIRARLMTKTKFRDADNVKRADWKLKNAGNLAPRIAMRLSEANGNSGWTDHELGLLSSATTGAAAVTAFLT